MDKNSIFAAFDVNSKTVAPESEDSFAIIGFIILELLLTEPGYSSE